MPLFMDQHDIRQATSEDLAMAHTNDVAVQAAHDVRFLTYWVDFPMSLANCLVEAPNPDAVNKVHGISHGQLANRVIRVNPSEVAAILGRLSDPDDGRLDSATRTFVFTDMVGSTTLFDTLGDQEAFKIVQDHDRLVRALLDRHHGREVKHTGDGLMLAFTSARRS
ncbi:MAG: nickel-binding protein [Acidimicrobiia bacterium]